MIFSYAHRLVPCPVIISRRELVQSLTARHYEERKSKLEVFSGSSYWRLGSSTEEGEEKLQKSEGMGYTRRT